MNIIEIVETNHGQTLNLPAEFRLAARTVTIRRVGNAILLEPIKPTEWPASFFEDIHIDDPAFVRPDQGSMPPAPVLD